MDIIGDLQRDWQHLRHHDGQQPASTAPATAPRPTEGDHMSQFTNDMHRFAAVLEKMGDDGARVLAVITDHPEGVAILQDIAAAAAIPLPPGALTAAFAGGRAVLAGWQAAHQAMQQPVAAPQTGAHPAMQAPVIN